MRRVWRQYFLLLVLFTGLTFLLFLLHNRTSPVISEDSSAVPKPDYNSLNKRIATIEKEIESQVHDSGILLNRLRAAKNHNLTLEQQLLQKVKGERDKLSELHRMLEQEAHLGEVHSGGDQEVDKGHIVAPDEDENHAREVMEDGSKEAVIAILVFVCNRPTVTRCLDKLIQYRPSKTQFPIILSQDCGTHVRTMEALAPYEPEMTHIFQPDLSKPKMDLGSPNQYEGYYKIARHYGWALNYTFNKLNYSQVVIVEDDLEVASDFFEYFSATLSVLKKDPTLWCISAWNDNGRPSRIDLNAPELLYRTDFFPGLGWMLTKDLWRELESKWAHGFWDDWMREPEQRQGRACIRPEISRTSTFGQIGVSRGTYYQTHLKFIKLNDKPVKFTGLDLSYLIKEKYDKEFLAQVTSATLITSIAQIGADEDEVGDVKKGTKGKEYRLEYRNNPQFLQFAKELQIMEDLRAGVPRTAYLGIVTTMSSKHRIYLVPNSKWLGYKS